MAFINFVQKSTVTSIISGTTLAASWPAATGSGPGTLLVAVIGFNTWPSNPTITPPADWVEISRSDTATTTRAGAVIYACLNPTSAHSGSESFTLSGDSDATLELLEYDAPNMNFVQGPVAENRSDSGSTTVDSGTTANNANVPALAIAALVSRSNADAGPPYDDTQSSPTNSFVEITQTETRNDTQGINTGSYEKILSSTGTVNTSATLVGSCYWSGVVSVFYIETQLELDQMLPDADTVTTGWTTTPLYSKVNDSSDATVIQATAV